jgi:polyhydroxybutyrate depolymerase
VITTGKLAVGGLERTYRLYVPGSLDRSKPAPLVVVLHGGFGQGAGAARQGNWDDVAEQHGFITVAPDGIGRSWNAGICCGAAQRRGIDDVGFVVALLDRVARDHPMDPARVYASGISNGGLMAYRLACEAADRFAAIAPVAATLPVSCEPSRPVSVIHVHGLADQNIPFEGGIGAKGVVKVSWPPARAGLERWAQLDGCSPAASTTSAGAVTTTSWGGCRNGTAVQLITIAGGGHSWPGGQRMSRALDPPSDALDATSTIWDFFAAHPKQA